VGCAKKKSLRGKQTEGSFGTEYVGLKHLKLDEQGNEPRVETNFSREPGANPHNQGKKVKGDEVPFKTKPE